jgi:hypothetical protein
MDIINKIRRIQTIVSILIFIGVFLFCWYVTKFNIYDIQLSYWGVAYKAASYWNGMTMVLALSLFFNVDYYIKNHHRMIDKKTIRLSFTSVFLALFLTGLVDMHHYSHNLTAVYYFFILPFTIYLMAYFNRKTIQYKEWLGHIIFSTCMIIFPLLFIHLFKGMAISEMIHSLIVMLWSLWILKKEFIPHSK